MFVSDGEQQPHKGVVKPRSALVRTDAQVALAWAKSFVSGTKEAVTKFEKDAAAQAAAAAQAGIDIPEA